MTDTIEDQVDKYLRLRDIKAKLKVKHTTELEPIEAALKAIEGALLTQFQATGTESVRTKAGTAYKSTRTSATVADWEQTLDYIKSHEMWDLLERRVSKNAVEEFKEEYNDLPPGINWREEVSINVRRS